MQLHLVIDRTHVILKNGNVERYVVTYQDICNIEGVLQLVQNLLQGTSFIRSSHLTDSMDPDGTCFN
jgi:hypothetical protein